MEGIDYVEKIKTDFLKVSTTAYRFGSIDDGGYYLSPSNILQADILFSGGISSNVEFEYDMFRFNKDLNIFMVDPTVSQTKLLTKAILRMFLLKKNKLKYLFNTLIFIYLTRTNRCWHFKKWLSEKNNIFDIIKTKIKEYEKSVIILKLDIEGSEYQLLDEIVANFSLFNTMIFEFHDLDKKHQILYDFLVRSSSYFDLIHLEINPSGGFDQYKRPKNIEISLERKINNTTL